MILRTEIQIIPTSFQVCENVSKCGHVGQFLLQVSAATTFITTVESFIFVGTNFHGF